MGVNRGYRCAFKKKDTGNIDVCVDAIKQIFEHLSKHSKSQEQLRHVHAAKSRTKIVIKELLYCIAVH